MISSLDEAKDYYSLGNNYEGNATAISLASGIALGSTFASIPAPPIVKVGLFAAGTLIGVIVPKEVYYAYTPIPRDMELGLYPYNITDAYEPSSIAPMPKLLSTPGKIP